MVYNILLDNKLIGTTKLEKADAPMGVVLGEISFIGIDDPYNFFKSYCTKNNIGFDDIRARILVRGGCKAHSYFCTEAHLPRWQNKHLH
jgi:hypothetical protein